MHLPDPDRAVLEAVAEHYGLGLSEGEVDEYAPVVQGLLGSWNAVEELYRAEAAPSAPQREWPRPEHGENPYNAWYVTTSITESGDGLLAGAERGDQGQHRAFEQAVGAFPAPSGAAVPA